MVLSVDMCGERGTSRSPEGISELSNSGLGSQARARAGIDGHASTRGQLVVD